MSCFRDNTKCYTLLVLIYFSIIVDILSVYNHRKRDILAEFICVFRVIQLTRTFCILWIHCNKIWQSFIAFIG